MRKIYIYSKNTLVTHPSVSGFTYALSITGIFCS